MKHNFSFDDVALVVNYVILIIINNLYFWT